VGPQPLPIGKVFWHDLPLLQRFAGPARPAVRREWLGALANPSWSFRHHFVSGVEPALLPYEDRVVPAPVGNDSWDIRREWENPTPEVRARALAAAEQSYARTLAGFRLGARPCAALREPLDSCQNEGVRAALVVPPEGRAFRAWYPPAAARAIEDYLGALGREYGVPVIDARGWVPDECDFLDSHHLLARGAERFTERLGREAVLPLLLWRTLRQGDDPR
jgi:hypothetical protein